MFNPALIMATLKLNKAKHGGSASRVGEELVKYAAAGATSETLADVLEFGIGIAEQAKRELQLRGLAS